MEIDTHFQAKTMNRAKSTSTANQAQQRHLNNADGGRQTTAVAPRVFLPFGLQEHLRQPYEGKAIFAKILGKKVEVRQFLVDLRRLWRPQGNLKISPLPNDYFLLVFSLASDCDRALQGGPWTIDKHCIALRPWSPNFRPSEAIVTRVVVWIRLPELPVEYYDPEALQIIAAPVGPLVKIHPVTESRSSFFYAKLGVELDLREPLLPCVELPGGVRQRILYEGLDELCDRCRRFGHLRENCSPPFSEPSTSHGQSRVNSFVNIPGPQVPSGHASGSQCSAFTGVPSDSRKKPGQGSAIATSLQFSEPSTSHGQSRVNSFANFLGPQLPSGNASGSGCSAFAGEPSDSRKKPGQGSAIATSLQAKDATYQKKSLDLENLRIGEGTTSALRNTHTSAQNKPVPTSSTQPQKTEEGTSVLKPPYDGALANHLSPNASTLPSLYRPAHMLHQVVSTPVPSVAGLQSVTSEKKEWFSELMEKVMEKREVNNTTAAEITESSTVCRPTVVEIDSKVPKLAIDVEMYASSNLHRTIIKPTDIDGPTKCAAASSSTKKILSWNCRGASEPRKVLALKHLCKAHNPSIVLLLDTRSSGLDADQVINDLGFSGLHRIDPVDNTGGVWLLWRKEHIQVTITSSAFYHIHAVAEFSSAECHQPGVYGVDSD